MTLRGLSIDQIIADKIYLDKKNEYFNVLNINVKGVRMKNKYSLINFVCICVLILFSSACVNSKQVNEIPDFVLILSDNSRSQEALFESSGIRSELVKSFERLSKDNGFKSKFIHITSKNKTNSDKNLTRIFNEILKNHTSVIFFFDFNMDTIERNAVALKSIANQNPNTIFISNLVFETMPQNIKTIKIDVNNAGVKLGYLISHSVERKILNRITLPKSILNPESLNDITGDRTVAVNEIDKKIKVAFFTDDNGLENLWFEPFLIGVESYNQEYLTNFEVEKFVIESSISVERLRTKVNKISENELSVLVLNSDIHNLQLLEIAREKQLKIVGIDVNFYFKFPAYQEQIIASGYIDFYSAFSGIIDAFNKGNELESIIELSSKNNYVTISDLHSFNGEISEKIKSELRKLSQ